MLGMADRDGIVEASVPGLAKRAGVEITATERALEKFMSPDPHSRSPEFEGRRIEKVDGGWRLLNFDKYAYRLSDDDRREKGRQRTRRWRERKSEGVTGRHTLSPSVTGVTNVTVTGGDGGDDTQTQTQRPLTPFSGDEPHPAPPDEAYPTLLSDPRSDTESSPDWSEWCLRTCRAYPAWMSSDTAADPDILQSYLAALEREAPTHGGMAGAAQWLLAVTKAYAAQHRGEDPQSLPYIGRWLDEALFCAVEMPVIGDVHHA